MIQQRRGVGEGGDPVGLGVVEEGFEGREGVGVEVCLAVGQEKAEGEGRCELHLNLQGWELGTRGKERGSGTNVTTSSGM